MSNRDCTYKKAKMLKEFGEKLSKDMGGLLEYLGHSSYAQDKPALLSEREVSKILNKGPQEVSRSLPDNNVKKHTFGAEDYYDSAEVLDHIIRKIGDYIGIPDHEEAKV